MKDLITDEAPQTDFIKIHKEAFINLKETVKHPPTALSIGQTTMGQNTYPNPFGTYGNFSCIVGASKTKKTFFKSLVMASYIGGDYQSFAPDFRTHRDKDKYVLDFDTEQGKWHSQNAFRRVLNITGGDYNLYKPYYLRKFDFRERLEFIEWCLLESEYKNNIGMVSIDGFADLVSDVNDLTQCNDLVQKLLKWTDKSKCHLTGIIHSNYGSSKATGHLGSAIQKKAETVCILTKSEEDFNLTNVEFKYTRGFTIDGFAFRINGEGLPVIEDMISKQSFL